MLSSVHLSSQVSRQIKVLLRAGGVAADAAEHAQAIIEQMIEGVPNLKQTGRFTRRGEARIPNCIKFDLVGGYRLIGVTGAREFSFVFLGSHDRCDHWLKNNIGLELVTKGSKDQICWVKTRKDTQEAGPRPEGAATVDADEDEAVLLRDLTDGDLRKIFCGICRKQT